MSQLGEEWAYLRWRPMAVADSLERSGRVTARRGMGVSQVEAYGSG